MIGIHERIFDPWQFKEKKQSQIFLNAQNTKKDAEGRRGFMLKKNLCGSLSYNSAVLCG
jgi:hypothetical protein